MLISKFLSDWVEWLMGYPITKPMDNRIKCSVCQQWREFGEVHDCSIETAQDGAKLFAALPGSVSEGQAWIVEYLCALRPWLRKATWEDMCAKMRDHAPDIYALLSGRGKTPNAGDERRGDENPNQNH